MDDNVIVIGERDKKQKVSLNLNFDLCNNGIIYHIYSENINRF